MSRHEGVNLGLPWHHAGHSAALFTTAVGYWPEKNVSSPSLQPQAWQMWGAGQAVLASVEASGDKAG